MTKQQFLKVMDDIKLKLVETDFDFSCHAISEIMNSRHNGNINNIYSHRSTLRSNYERLYDIDTHGNVFSSGEYDYRESIRISALELFEIVSLEEKLYLNY